MPYEDLVEPAEVEAFMQPGGGAVIVDFWSPTCGPCRAMAQDFADVATQFDPEEVRFCKIDTANYPELAAAFRIRSVPTILFIHNGEVQDAVIGKMSAKDLGTKAEWLVGLSQQRPGWFSRLFGRSG